MNSQTAGTHATNGHARGTITSVAPSVDIYESQDELLVVAELPGVTVEGLEVRVENDTLHLVARRPGGEPGPALERGFRATDYARSFRLPPGIDGDRVDAELKDGVLRIKLPKAESAKPRKIAVKASS